MVIFRTPLLMFWILGTAPVTRGRLQEGVEASGRNENFQKEQRVQEGISGQLPEETGTSGRVALM